MDSRQAKEILLRHRPGTSDENDPELAQALAQARTDAQLGRWFEQHHEFQKFVAEQLRQIPVPIGLKEAILARHEHQPWPTPAWWRRPVVQALAAAAAVALLASLILLPSRPTEDRSFAAYRNRLARIAQRGYLMDVTSTNLAEIRKYMASHQAPADYVLPNRLEQLPGDGGAVLHWNSKTVSMVCFDLGNHQDLYLFIASQSDLPDPPPAAQPEFVRVGRLTAASWSAGDKVYVLAGPGDEQFLRRFLGPK